MSTTMVKLTENHFDVIWHKLKIEGKMPNKSLSRKLLHHALHFL